LCPQWRILSGRLAQWRILGLESGRRDLARADEVL
jgi:hypothetical protein